MDPITIVFVVLAGAGGYGASQAILKKNVGSAEHKASQKVEEAKKEADSLKLSAEKEALQIKSSAQKDLDQSQRELKEAQQRIAKRESNIDSKLEDLDKRSQDLRKSEEDLINLKEEIKKIRAKQEDRLEGIAKLNKDEAKDQLFKMVEKDISTDLMNYVAKKQKEAERTAEERSQEVLLSAMERVASDVTAERTITAIKIDDDQIKGRVIGKEGRNIQALQKATGVDILMDETPGMIILSCYDPIRRQVARVALENLIKDGRIQPAKIEEAVEKAQKNIDKDVERAAEDACREVGIAGLPPQVMRHLGELRFRTSYGQNVLKHSVEMAHIAGLIADEIGADARIARTGALLHDLGKALSHKIEGKHHLISGDLLRKYGLGEEVAHAAEAHHEDIDATTPEAMVVRVVDSLSAARPGARNISAENFAQRMKDLENTATSFAGVDKAYAITAGREVRVIVESKRIDDLSAFKLARDIADKIESTMSYPGTIKVNVIRETRAIEYAK